MCNGIYNYCFVTDAFYIKETAERNCELRLKRTLDFETTRRYEIEVQLKTSVNLIDQDRGTVRVILNLFSPSIIHGR